jgi:xylan 1,4-beta-xylosidase
VDFIATHTYAVTQGFLDADGNGGTVFAPNRDSISGDVLRVRQQIAASALPKLELHFTEWSASYTPSDPIHDSYHSAAFILDRLKQAGDATQSLSYWVFTDIFEEAGPRWTPFHGGFGLLNYQDIRKPACFAYQFLNRLGATELKNSDTNSWVCTAPDGSVQALLWNFTYTHPGTNVNNQNFYNHDLPSAPKDKVTLQLSHLPKGNYTMEIFKVGYRANDAYTAYLDLGAPNQLSRAQVARLNAAASGAPESRATMKVGKDGAFKQEFVLRDNDAVLVTLTPQRK